LEKHATSLFDCKGTAFLRHTQDFLQKNNRTLAVKTFFHLNLQFLPSSQTKKRQLCDRNCKNAAKIKNIAEFWYENLQIRIICSIFAAVFKSENFG